MKAPEIKMDPRNYRKHSEQNKKVIKKSLQELGAGRSVVIDADDTLVAGNGVYEQAQKLKMPVRVVETDGSELVVVKRTDIHTEDEKRRKLALADNAASDLSEWDVPLLETDWAKDALGDWGVELPGFETMSAEEAKDVQEDDFDEEKDKVETVCKKGDIWLLGQHRLMCGDSTDAEQIALLMDGEKADMWLTDPPYNVDYQGSTGLKIQNDSMKDDEFLAFLTKAYQAAADNMKAGSPYYIWHADLEGYNFRAAAKAVGLLMKQLIIWNKNSIVVGRQDYQVKHEPCLYGWKAGAPHKWYGDRNKPTVIDFDKPKRNDDHPTMKPVGLFGQLISNSSREHEIVLDTFGGSGTTVIACEQLNRKARMMELDPHYCDVIIARWEKLTGQKATRL